ncbi:MAG: AAA family ATPase, partial [Deltaproteobacteria bacterium]|nr:AAA family ATPase [Deltaproteobacteria bacterium]
ASKLAARHTNNANHASQASHARQTPHTAPKSQARQTTHASHTNQAINGQVTLDKIQQSLFNEIEHGSGNYLIQGQAGTGKSTFIQYFKDNTSKAYCVVCPTGIAAVNVGGATIHSLFRLPISDILDPKQLHLSTKTMEILVRIKVLIVDEVSMVRPDILDAIDRLAKMSRKSQKPFGGLQVILIGDLAQLPPVITKDVREIFETIYGYAAPFFFDAVSFKKGNFKLVEFTTIYRQNDVKLMNNLYNIRTNTSLRGALDYFNSAKFGDQELFDKSITLTPYKKIAEGINKQKLESIDEEPQTYLASFQGQFDPERDVPAPVRLTLKPGALVLFNRSYPPLCQNGTSATVESLEKDLITVKLLNNNIIVEVKPVTWEKLTYEYDPKTNQIAETVIGSYTQFPLQLGYAMTIHKAQGKTLDKAVIDVSRGTFSHGQLYVALSRTRNKNDMHIKTQLEPGNVIIDERVAEFLRRP